MRENELIHVLWVEDDPEVRRTYPLKAETFDLDLVSYLCWDDARDALKTDFDKWSAIILDAKCKYHRDSDDNAIVFLREALKDIATICQDKRRVIPWYVLTGGAENEVSDSINDDRLKWDSEWTELQHKKYYSKNVDNEALYKRIRIHAQKSTRIQIREIYRDTIEQLSLLNSEEICDVIVTILEAMHYPDSHTDFNPQLYYNSMRKGLEYVFRILNKNGIIPDDFIYNGLVNLNQCFMFLIGRDAEKVGFRYGCYGEKIVPRHIQDMMSLILYIGNSGSHSTELSKEEITRYDNQITLSGISSKYLLFSMALQLCEIVSWMNCYVANHPDKEENLKKCIKIEDNEKEKKANVETEIIGVVEREKGFYHVEGKYCLNPKIIQQNGWLGRMVKIIKYDTNTNEKTKELYPFFGVKIQLVEESENGSR